MPGHRRSRSDGFFGLSAPRDPFGSQASPVKDENFMHLLLHGAGEMLASLRGDSPWGGHSDRSYSKKKKKSKRRSKKSRSKKSTSSTRNRARRTAQSADENQSDGRGSPPRSRGNSVSEPGDDGLKPGDGGGGKSSEPSASSAGKNLFLSLGTSPARKRLPLSLPLSRGTGSRIGRSMSAGHQRPTTSTPLADITSPTMRGAVAGRSRLLCLPTTMRRPRGWSHDESDLLENIDINSPERKASARHSNASNNTSCSSTGTPSTSCSSSDNSNASFTVTPDLTPQPSADARQTEHFTEPAPLRSGNTELTLDLALETPSLQSFQTRPRVDSAVDSAEGVQVDASDIQDTTSATSAEVSSTDSQQDDDDWDTITVDASRQHRWICLSSKAQLERNMIDEAQYQKNIETSGLNRGIAEPFAAEFFFNPPIQPGTGQPLPSLRRTRAFQNLHAAANLQGSELGTVGTQLYRRVQAVQERPNGARNRTRPRPSDSDSSDCDSTSEFDSDIYSDSEDDTAFLNV